CGIVVALSRLLPVGIATSAHRATWLGLNMARVDFDASDLAAQLDALSDAERDELPFGVILLDREGIVRFYSKTEARISKYQGQKIGVNFFDLAKRVSKDELWNSIQRAMEAGKVDL